MRGAILEEATLAVTVKGGPRTVRAIELAYKSSKEGRTLLWHDD